MRTTFHSRRSIPALLVLIVSAMTAIPAFAQFNPGPPGIPELATVAGPVTSVTPEKRLIALLGGDVVIDASAASITGLTGPVTFDAIVPGSQITARIHPGDYSGNRPMLAMDISVLPRLSISLAGRIESVDTAGSTLTVLGRTIRVTPQTRFFSSLDGPAPSGIGDLQKNQQVIAELTSSAEGLTAVSVVVLLSGGEPIILFAGKVARIASDEWVIETGDPRGSTFKITAQTRIEGNPRVGDTVTVTARQEGGTLIALAITLGRPQSGPPLGHLTIAGRLAELAAGYLILTQASLAQLRFTVTPDTRFVGEPRIGDEVLVTAAVVASGEQIAIEVTKVPGSTPLRLTTVVGTVTSMTEARWTVGRWMVLISPRSTIAGQVKVGSRVRLIGERQSDTNVMLAYAVYKE